MRGGSSRRTQRATYLATANFDPARACMAVLQSSLMSVGKAWKSSTVEIETNSPFASLFLMAITTQSTSFTKDVQGRYLCNDFSELPGQPFDFIVVGGGTFGAAIAEHLWFRQKQSGGGLRTLVVEACARATGAAGRRACSTRRWPRGRRRPSTR